MRPRNGGRASSHVGIFTAPWLQPERHAGEIEGRAQIVGEITQVGGGEGARLAHIAAHGIFRGDAPLFSALMLADGPLTVHDLRQLERPPTSFVLSACDSGGAAPIGPFEALGLVASLLGMGTSSVLASVVPVNDQACLSVMADVHRIAGCEEGTLAEGWLAARQAAAGDDLASATAASFTAWGA